jgi:hypothetical protein
MINECGAYSGTIIGRGKLGKRPLTVSYFSSQTPHNLTWDQTRAAALGCRGLTATAAVILRYIPPATEIVFFH